MSNTELKKLIPAFISSRMNYWSHFLTEHPKICIKILLAPTSATLVIKNLLQNA